jgi:hypothetical protein
VHYTIFYCHTGEIKTTGGERERENLRAANFREGRYARTLLINAHCSVAYIVAFVIHFMFSLKIIIGFLWALYTLWLGSSSLEKKVGLKKNRSDECFYEGVRERGESMRAEREMGER